MRYSKFIIKCLKNASDIAKDYFGKTLGTFKPDDPNQVLTKADIQIGKFLIGEIKREYSSYNIIDEEAGVIDNKSEFTWVIDPIDGTSNFTNCIPIYGIMLGLLKNEEPIAGGVSLPFFDEIYSAEKQSGTYLNGKRIFVTKETDLEKTLVACGLDSNKNFPQKTKNSCLIIADIVDHVLNIRTSHSVFDFMQVAKGSYGGALELDQTKIWNNVANQIIIQEAGGIYTGLKGPALDYSHPITRISRMYNVCTASPALHVKLQAIIHGHQN